MIRKYLTAFLCGITGGWLFSLAHLPIPWTLGPLVTVIVANAVFKKELFWSSQMRNIGFLIVGYVLGSPFTAEAGRKILVQFPLILFITLVTIGISLFFGYAVNRYTRLSPATVIFGSIPGGLAQISTICEDIENADTAVVTLLQTIRVLSVVFFVPFIALHGLADEVYPISGTVVNFENNYIFTLFLFASAIAALILLFKYLGISSRYIIAPMLATAGLVLAGIHAPPLPFPLIAVGQVFIGLQLGRAIKVDRLANWKTIAVFGVLGMLGVLTSVLFISYLFEQTTAISMLTAFISIAPGGIAEMGVTAMMVHADLSIVIAFQLFRLLFILLILIPLAKWWLTTRHGKELIRS